MSTEDSDSVNKSVEEKLFDRIQELQDQERDLYNQLETESTANPDEEKIQEIIEKIDKLTKTRDVLYDKLSTDLNKSAENINNLSTHLQDQIETTNIVENQLQKARERAEQIKQTKRDTTRMVELGQYEAERYKAHKNLIKLMIYFLLGILSVVLLLKYNVIPSIMGSVLITIIMVVLLIVVGQRMYDLSTRSNLDYKKYDWGFDADEANRGMETVLQFDEGEVKKAEGEIENGMGLNDLRLKPGLITTIYKSDADGNIGDFLTQRITDKINYGPDSDNPIVSDRNNDFYVRFSGIVKYKPGYEKVKFRVGSDDGSRLAINGQILINEWKIEPYQKYTTDEMEFKQDLPIELEMFQHRGGSAITLEWKINDKDFEIIPHENLMHM